MVRRMTIPGLDRFLYRSSLIDGVVFIQDSLRARIGTVCHITVFEKILNFVENIVDWGERVIANFGNFFFF